MKALVYWQSGGPTAVINSSLYGVILERRLHKEISHLYGSLYGVEGLFKDDLVDLDQEDDKDISLLPFTPGSALFSTRFRLPPDNDPLWENIVSTIQKHDIGYLLINGGNDSMDSCARLASFFKKRHLSVSVIGIPKTIDNDLLVTDHSIGYPSAAKHVINTLKMVTVDAMAYRKGKVIIVEIMGRDSGWLTASVDLLPEGERPDLIMLPELPLSEEEFLAEVKAIFERRGHCVIAMSEGIALKHVNSEKMADSFGHKALEGVARTASSLIASKLGIPVRSFELSVLQRADPLLISAVDQEEAIGAARYAVKAAIGGESGKMVCLKRLSNVPYRYDFYLYDVSKIANLEKKIPASMLGDDRHMTQVFRDYLSPLVEGEIHPSFSHGVFSSSHLKLIKVP